MINILRFFRELWRPALKCQRIGHAWRTQELVIRKQPGDGYRTVASDYWAVRNKCARCGECTKPVQGALIQSFHGVTMPDYMWGQLEKDGYVVMSE